MAKIDIRRELKGRQTPNHTKYYDIQCKILLKAKMVREDIAEARKHRS